MIDVQARSPGHPAPEIPCGTGAPGGGDDAGMAKKIAGAHDIPAAAHRGCCGVNRDCAFHVRRPEIPVFRHGGDDRLT
jgi:hypothetical protein